MSTRFGACSCDNPVVACRADELLEGQEPSCPRHACGEQDRFDYKSVHAAETGGEEGEGSDSEGGGYRRWN